MDRQVSLIEMDSGFTSGKERQTEEYEEIFAEGSDQRDQWEPEGFDEMGNDIPEFYLEVFNT